MGNPLEPDQTVEVLLQGSSGSLSLGWDQSQSLGGPEPTDKRGVRKHLQPGVVGMSWRGQAGWVCVLSVWKSEHEECFFLHVVGC